MATRVGHCPPKWLNLFVSFQSGKLFIADMESYLYITFQVGK